MTYNGVESSEIIRNMTAVLYDGDWISSEEIENITVKTPLKEITQLDFSGFCLIDMLRNIEELYDISLDDVLVKNCTTFGDIVNLVMPLLEIH